MVTNLADAFHPLFPGWRPGGPTLLLTTREGVFNESLVAVSLSGGSGPLKLLEFSGGWDVRPDGAVLAAFVTTPDGPRLATYSLFTGERAWVTGPERTLGVHQPVWSRDGTWLYYAADVGGAPDFKGTLFRVRPDGTDRSALATMDRFGGVQGLTPDGGSLLWARIQAGGSAEVFDLTTRTNRHLGDVASVTSIRARQPRILVQVGGCCAGFPGGELVLWNDAAMTSRTLAARGAGGSPAWGSASWDPSGTRIVAVRYDADHRYTGVLTFIDPDTSAMSAVSGSPGASDVTWLTEGILYTVRAELGTDVEVKLVSPTGGTPATLFKGSDASRMVMIRP